MGVSGVFQPPPMAVTSLFYNRYPSLPLSNFPISNNIGRRRRESGRISGMVFISKEDTPSTSASISTPPSAEEQTEQIGDPDPEDLEYVKQIKTVISSHSLR